MASLQFFESLLDSLDQQIAVIKPTAEIVYVNRSWIDFGLFNGMPENFSWVGVNYLRVCDAGSGLTCSEISTTAAGIREVLAGRLDSFEAEYPCHSPSRTRWFMMRISVMKYNRARRFLISHTNITARKLAELAVQSLSLTDPLTGLANRRRLDDFLGDAWRRALRVRRPVSLAIFDVDHFKELNDTLGHMAGDRCLVKISRILANYTNRPTDLAARFGGEEFVIVLAETPLGEALAVATRILETVAGLGVTFGDGRQLTISAGVSNLIPVDSDNGAELIALADKALYRAKDGGRNRVMSLEQPMRHNRKNTRVTFRPIERTA